MKNAILLFTITLLFISCSKEKEEELKITSIDQVNGIFQWESTCGGYSGGCGYASTEHYGEFIFSTTGQFTEKFNDSIYLTAEYSIVKVDEKNGSLMLYNIISNIDTAKIVQYSMTILNNKLCLMRGDIFYTFHKTR